MATSFKFKDPNAPATDKQEWLFNKIMGEKGYPAEGFAPGTTMAQASDAIDAAKLLDPAQPTAQPSLVDMAKGITQGTPVAPAAPAPVEDDGDLEDTAPVMLAFDREECKALRSAVSCLIGESDGTEMDHVLMAKLTAFVYNTPQPTELDLPHYIGGGTVQIETAGTIVNGKVTQIDAATGTELAPKINGVPAGRYAIEAADGTFDFYKVEHGKDDSKWAGFVFVSKQAGDEFIPVKANHGKGAILEAIAADPLAAAKAYGTQLGVCGICAKTLTDPDSIAAGIGPKCAKRLGA